MTRRSDDGGSMLVELIVGMILMSVVATLVLDGIVSGFSTQRELTNRGEAMESLRRAAQRVSREIREADSLSNATATTLRLTHPTNTGTIERYYELNTARTKLMMTTIVAGTSTTTEVIGDLDPTSSPFRYVAVHDYVAGAATINATTCAISATSPVAYSHDCIGSVQLVLARLVKDHSPVSVDTLVDLRNVT